MSTHISVPPQLLLERILTLEIVRVTERAAVSAARLRGHGNEKAADQAAVDAMRRELNKLPIEGTVVIGEGERDEAPMLFIGEKVGMARPVHHQRGDVGGGYALGLGEIADVLLGRGIEVDHALGVTGADCDLLHVDVGRVEQRAAFGHRHGGDRARHVLCAKCSPLERVDRDIDLGAFFVADRLADEKHRRLVALALPDHDNSVDRQLVELAPHGVDRRLIRRLLIAAPAPARRRHRRALGHAHDFERENALQ